MVLKPASRVLLLGISILVALGLAAAPGRTAERAACLKVSPALRTVLDRGLRPVAEGRLGTLRAVRAEKRFAGAPGSFRKGAYFVSARLRGSSAVATWAVDPRAFTTGGGAIYAVGKTARGVSYFGATFSQATLNAWGFSTHALAYKQSRACVAG